jgi:hypothetical protein
MMVIALPLNGTERKRVYTQPRWLPTVTSHHRQLATQPSTLTEVPLRSQVTAGKICSGPARTLTEAVVVAVCAAAV